MASSQVFASSPSNKTVTITFHERLPTTKTAAAALASLSKPHPAPNDKIPTHKIGATVKLEAAAYCKEHGATKTVNFFKEHRQLTLHRTSVIRWRNKYKQLKKQQKIINEVQTLKPLTTIQHHITSQDFEDKHGRPSHLGPRLTEILQQSLQQVRVAGGIVNSTITLAYAYGIVKFNEPFRLRECGGTVELNRNWAKKFLQRNNWVKRKATTGHRHIPEDFEQIKAKWIQKVTSLIQQYRVPPSLVFNFDQTGLHLVPAGDWTMDISGTDTVSIVEVEDKCQITGVVAGNMEGKLLPLQLLYQGTTEKCHPSNSDQAPPEYHIHHSKSHWSTTQTNIEYIDKVLSTFCDQERRTLNLPPTQWALALFDFYKAQIDPEFLTHLLSKRILFALVPAGCTDLLQPMDLSVNKIFKENYRGEFIKWYSREIYDKLSARVPAAHIKVDLTMKNIKPLSLEWITTAHNNIPTSTVKKGFIEAGLTAIYTNNLNILTASSTDPLPPPPSISLLTDNTIPTTSSSTSTPVITSLTDSSSSSTPSPSTPSPSSDTLPALPSPLTTSITFPPISSLISVTSNVSPPSLSQAICRTFPSIPALSASIPPPSQPTSIVSRPIIPVLAPR